MTIETLKRLFKFSLAQACSDQNGKSSMSPPMAAIIIITGCIGFLKGVIMKETDALTQSVVIIGIGAGLLGYHKSVDGHPRDMGVTDPNTATNTQTLAQVTTVTQQTTIPDPPPTPKPNQ